MIVAMRAVGVVEMAVHQVIRVIPVRYRLVAAFGAVSMRLLMSRAGVIWRASVRIHRVHFNTVIFDGIAVRMVQMTIVEIIRVAIVFDSRMATVRAMLVAMSVCMLLVSITHGGILSQCDPRPEVD